MNLLPLRQTLQENREYALRNRGQCLLRSAVFQLHPAVFFTERLTSVPYMPYKTFFVQILLQIGIPRQFINMSIDHCSSFRLHTSCQHRNKMLTLYILYHLNGNLTRKQKKQPRLSNLRMISRLYVIYGKYFII